MKVNYELIGVVIAAIVAFAGIISWWISKFLSDKKDITVLQVKMKDLERRVAKNEEKIEKVEGWYNGDNNH